MFDYDFNKKIIALLLSIVINIIIIYLFPQS